MMFKIYACLTGQHDYRLVALAALVCLSAAGVAINLLQRLNAARGVDRAIFLVIIAAVTGIGVWATHFIAMLAFKPGVAVGYDLSLTLVSLVAAIGLIGLGFLIAVSTRLPRAPALGGGVIGAAIAVMHYLGMAGFRVQGFLVWDPQLVFWSLACGLVFGPLALCLALSRRGASPLGQAGAAGLLTLAICGLHFTAMSAAAVVPAAVVRFDSATMAPQWLGVWVASGALALLVISVLALVMGQRQRSAESRRRHDLANTAVEGLVVCDAGVITTANASFCALVGLDEAAVIGRRLDAFLPDEAAAERMATGQDERFETLITSVSGEAIAAELITRMLTYDGRLHQGVAVRDLRARHQADAQIRYLAHHDSQTGLLNRASFNERLDRVIDRHQRKEDSFAVLCLDLDRFKQVNDIFGHGAGDTVLKTVSNRVTALLDESDVFARLGGDEFALIRLGPSRPADLALLGEQILQAVSAEIPIDGAVTTVGVSIGIALFPADGATAGPLMRHADAALYQAKDDGRGAYRFFEPGIGADLRRRQDLEFDLRHAIERNQFKVVYQPQTYLETGETFGFEALLRWSHPVRGNVPPMEFIPVAEDSGLIKPIGEWVLRRACAEAASWTKPLQLAVNLSGVQLHCADLADLVAAVLKDTGLAPERLELEITETALISDFDRALRSLRAIKALGVKIAMDDFGAGYASLSNLRAFPFDKIKIDRSFIHNVDGNEQGATIVRAILGLARGLGLAVLAEGVETQEELDFLGLERCAEAQGYLFGRPGDISDFAQSFADPAQVVAASLTQARVKRSA